IVRERIQVWIFPWSDPSGRAYQIVQSLIAIANGGVFGRGPGLGNPGLVPIAHSDFIFAAIVEESGLFGAIALLMLWALLFQRGLSVAFHAPTRFQRLLAAGISLYLGLQGLVIIGGNLRIFPLTGVTLPLISYGGSSLLAGMLSILLLLLISHHPDSEPMPLRHPWAYYQVGLAFLALSGAMALAVGWWGVVRSERLLARTDNPRRAIADLYVRRGSLVDRLARPLNETVGSSGSYQRTYHYPPLSPLLGYTHAVYGQAGLEASLDDWLRGRKGNPAFVLRWNHLLYGTPPPGLDVRLSLDLDLQRFADDLLGKHVGAVVVLNARSGEVLVSASHPWFDPNHLGENWETWISDPVSPFLNRVTQGHYPLDGALLPWEQALLGESGIYAPSAAEQAYSTLLGMGAGKSPTYVAPLEVVRVGATLSAAGVKPATRFVLAVNTPGQGWVVVPAEGESKLVLSPFQARALAQRLTPPGAAFWEYLAEVKVEKPVTWYLAGTLPEWQGTSIALVVLLEEDNPRLAKQIGQAIMRRWMLGE
ncbi:MAG: FtsW/RodA/SpoVE family cell cycle protein, partial [Anaerolineales bacterium]